MRHVYIMDPMLFGNTGHYLNYDANLVRDLQARKIPVTLFAHRDCKVMCAGIKPEPLFTKEALSEAATDPQIWALENFFNLNQLFLADLCRINAAKFTRDDLLFFPNLLQNQMYGLSMWLSRLPEDKRPSVVVMLRYLQNSLEHEKVRANNDVVPLFIRYACRTLVSNHPRTILCTDTHESVGAFQQMTDVPFLEVPNPMDVVPYVARNENRPENIRPVVVFQGHTDRRRGFHFLPEIIENCLKLESQPRFIVQLQREYAVLSKFTSVVEKLDKMAGEDLKIVNGSISQSEYFNLMTEADILLLPYSSNHYGHNSSGVFNESMSLGKVAVVTAGTVPARMGREYQSGIVVAHQWTASAVAEATVQAVREFQTLSARSKAAAPRFREEQCAKAFWDRILGAPAIRTEAAA